MMDLLDRLAKDRIALLIATHEIDQAHEWERVLCLNHRQVAFGPPGSTLTPEVLRATFPGPFDVLSHQGHEP
jgi:ABC-type Mn2+/Zn2+ transport system ATPase subunit